MSAGEPGIPLVKVYSAADIGADALSFTATHDADGVLYVGATTVLRFDGENWASVPVPGSYAVRHLEFGQDGRLWVAAFGEVGWFESGPAGPGRFHSLRDHLPADVGVLGEMWYVFADASGGATFVSDDRILHWDGSRFETWPMPGGRRLPSVRIGATVYVHHLPSGLYALTPAGPELVVPRSVLGQAAILWIEPGAGHWLLATSLGLFHLEGNRLEPFAPVVSAYIRRERLTSVVRLRDGRYALGTFAGGIVIMAADGTLDALVTVADGLPSDIIKALHVDRDGQLWAMSQSSVFRFDPSSPSRVFDARTGLPEQSYHAITRYGGRIVVAGERGVYAGTPSGRHFEPLSANADYAHDVRGSPAGLLVATPKGVRRISGGQAETLHRTDHDVFAALPSRRVPGRTYVADHRSVLAIDPDGTKRLLVLDLPDYARQVEEDDTGRLWIETVARGVLVAQPAPDSPAMVVAVPDEFGLPALTGRPMVRSTADGGIIILANSGGWIKAAGQTSFSPIVDFPARALAAVSSFGPDGSAWAVHGADERHSAAVGRILVEGAGARWSAHDVPGLPSIGLPRAVFVDSGRHPVLWIGGTRSVLRHVVAHGPSAPPPRSPLLRVTAQLAPDAPAQAVTAALPYATRALSFELAAPQFARRDSLRLESRIDGIDSDWIPAGPNARRELNAVREGRYRFAVRAIAGTGAVSESTVFSFEVLPPWWRTAPVVIGFAVALVPLGFGAYRLRTRTLRRRNVDLEAKVRRRTEELEAASAAKTEFVANMSHDIRNPLNGIVGLALALEDTRLDRRQREIVATLRECTTYLSSLVDDVLDFASIEAGRIEVRSGSFAPGELLRSIVETLRIDAAQSGAVLTIEAGSDVPPHLRGDAGRIQQILVNFVSNALKYSGGRIGLSVHVPNDGPDEVEFAVQDEGPGISAADLPGLFTKFTRLQQKHGAESIPGTGLGLAACRLLADAMGGSVGVISHPGHGARFFLRLPLAIAIEPASPPPDLLAEATVLLVEDTDYNAWAVSAVLARVGLRCERASTGEEALRLFSAKRFNIVLLDRNLPDMDGTEVARRMREMEKDGAHAVLLAVTAYCTAQDRDLCLRAGMDAFVGKPLTPEKLRRVLADASRQLVGAAPMHVAPQPRTVEPDLTLLTYLGAGSAEGLDELRRRFVSELDELQCGIAAAAEAGDFATQAALAHRILGHARMVGGTALAGTAFRLEVAARSRDPAAGSECLARVQDESAALRAAVLHHCPASPSE